MRADSSQKVAVFDSLADALGSFHLPHTLIVTRGTGLKKLHDSVESARILQVPEGEPKLTDLITLDLDSLKGIRRIVSIGGGSVIDFGKGLLALAEFPEVRTALVGTPRRLYSIGSEYSSIEHVVIPTRAGSGAEASSSAIFLEGSRKIPILGNALVPTSVIWVPSLLPRKLSHAIVGILDMLGHAVESLLSSQTNKELDLAALDSVRTLMELSEKSELTDWDNLRLLRESLSSGRCQDLRLVSIPHALSHAFATGFPHGLLVGNFLSQFLAGLQEAEKERFDYLEGLFSSSSLSLVGFQTVLDELVSRCNRELGVEKFENIDFSQAQLAFGDASSRLTSVKIGEHNFSHFNFKRPAQVA